MERPLTGLGLVIPKDRMEGDRHGAGRSTCTVTCTAYLQVAVSMELPALAVFLWLPWNKRLGLGAPRRFGTSGGGLVAPIRDRDRAGRDGLFEWNFGDSEILGLFWLVSGCVLGVARGDQT
jgi:hypothetical protein